MNEITSRIDEIGDVANIVAICHHGMRSMQVARYLSHTRQFENILNLSGGIDAWASDVDKTVTRY
jgi:rhodanese-related sulfurtransferase